MSPHEIAAFRQKQPYSKKRDVNPNQIEYDTEMQRQQGTVANILDRGIDVARRDTRRDPNRIARGVALVGATLAFPNTMLQASETTPSIDSDENTSGYADRFPTGEYQHKADPQMARAMAMDALFIMNPAVGLPLTGAVNFGGALYDVASHFPSDAARVLRALKQEKGPELGTYPYP
jgi:hypothetical protein